MSQADTITYREAVDADLATLIELMTELIDELGPHEQNQSLKERLPADLETALASNSVVIYLACAGPEVIGLSRGDILSADPIFRLREDNRCGYIDQMYVRASHRRRGVGRELLTLCEEWFRGQGIKHCILHAAVRAIRFYARAGYQSNREMFKKL